MSETQGQTVLPKARVVAAGREGGLLRAALLLDPARSSGGIALDSWPSAVEAALRQSGGVVSVRMGFAEPGTCVGSSPPSRVVELRFTRPPAQPGGPSLAELDGEWRRMMAAPQGAARWARLAALLEPPDGPPTLPPTAAVNRAVIETRVRGLRRDALHSDLREPGRSVTKASQVVPSRMALSSDGWTLKAAQTDLVDEAVEQAAASNRRWMAARESWEEARLRGPEQALAALSRQRGDVLLASDRWEGEGGGTPDPVMLNRAGSRRFANGLLPSAEEWRLGQLRSHQSLLRLFRLVVDLEIRIGDLPAGLIGELAAPAFVMLQPNLGMRGGLDLSDAAGRVWTLAKISLPAKGGGFLPCTREEADGAADRHLPQIDGFANLGETDPGSATGSAGSDPRDIDPVSKERLRYKLTSLDTIAASEHFGAANPSSSLVNHQWSGREALRGAGITLLDLEPQRTACANAAAACCAALMAVELHDATRLRTGWQMDVATAGGARLDWRSLMSREITYYRDDTGNRPLTAWIEAAYGGRDARERRRLAEAAAISTPPKVHEAGPGSSKPGEKSLIHESVVVQWSGQPLGLELVDKPGADAGSQYADPGNRDLVVRADYDLPTSGTRPPPLAVGARYNVRLRAVYAGGVCASPGDPSLTMVSSRPHRHQREEPLAAPAVLHLQADVLDGARAARGSQAEGERLWELPGEAPLPRARDMFLRPVAGSGAAPRSRRVLFPANRALEFVHEHDAVRQLVRDSILRDGLREVEFGTLAQGGGEQSDGWPTFRAVGNSVIAVSEPGRAPFSLVESTSGPARVSPLSGDALLRASGGFPRRVPYLPDPVADSLAIALAWSASGKPFASIPPVPFYGASGAYPNPQPVVIELLPRAASGLPTLSAGPSTILPLGGGRELRASVVQVHLAPGESVQVLAWCVPRSLADTFSCFEQDAAGEALAAEAAAAIVRRPVRIVAGVTPISAAHGTVRLGQADAPSIALSGDLAEWLQSDSKANLILQGTLRAAFSRTSSIEVVASAYGLVSGDFDRPAERYRDPVARAAGEWPLAADGIPLSTRDVFGFSVAPDGKVTLVPERAVILRYKPSAAAGGPAWPESVPLSGLEQEYKHALADGKARRLTLTPLAYPGATGALVNRFDEAPPAEPVRGAETAGVPAGVSGAKLSKPRELWMLASKRPAAVAEPWVLPAFGWKHEHTPNGGTLTRETVLRIMVARPWFTSGEGEQIGIVLWPPHLFDLPADAVEADRLPRPQGDAREMDLRDVSELDLGPGGRFVTRWGHDPIKEQDLARGLLLSKDNFPGSGVRTAAEPVQPGEGWVVRPHVRMPVPVAAAGAGGTQGGETWLEACLLTREPNFDPDRELWFADLSVRIPRSIEPFLRIGLVRYQEHAPPELQCSLPVTAWAQLPPTRRLEWQVNRADGRPVSACVTVLGPASRFQGDVDGLDPLPLPQQRPQMRFSLVRIEDLPGAENPGATTEVEQPECTVCSACEPSDRDQVDGLPREAGLLWSATLEIEAEAPQGARYAIQVEEAETLPSASGAGPTARPRYAARIELT